MYMFTHVAVSIALYKLGHYLIFLLTVLIRMTSLINDTYLLLSNAIKITMSYK